MRNTLILEFQPSNQKFSIYFYFDNFQQLKCSFIYFKLLIFSKINTTVSLGQTCAETNEIIFLSTTQFVVLNGQNFQYQRRYVTNLSLIQSRSQPSLLYFGNTIRPDANFNEIFFISGDGLGNYFVVQYDLDLNSYIQIANIQNHSSVNNAKFQINIQQQKILIIDPINGVALSDFSFCLDGQYYDTLIGLCSSCIANCISCINGNQCLICDNTTILNAATKICESLTNTTNTTTSTTNTTTNATNTNATNTTSTNSCLQGYYQKIIGTCQKCQQHCRQCNQSTCLTPKFFATINQNGTLQLEIWAKAIVMLSSTPNLRIFFDKPALLYVTTDRIWLYQYQQQEHHKTLRNVFQTINLIENQKFIPFQIDQYINLQISKLLNLQIYKNFAHPKFIQIQGTCGTIAESLEYYLVFSLPSSIIIFFLMYLVFILCFNFSISLYFRQFSLFGFLLVALLEPNIQYSTFLFANQMKMLFFQSFHTKLMMIATILGFFIIFIFAIAAYILFYYHYKKLAKYFVEDCYRTLRSFICYGLYIGLKSVLLGFTHAFLFKFYLSQLLTLMMIQIVFIVFMIYFWKKQEIYLFQSVASFLILNSICMLLFQFVLISQQIFTKLGGQVTKQVQDIFDWLSFISLIALMCNSILGFFCKLIVPYLVPLMNKKQGHQKEQFSQTNSTSKYSDETEQQVKITAKIKMGNREVNVNIVADEMPRKKIRIKKTDFKDHLVIKMNNQVDLDLDQCQY